MSGGDQFERGLAWFNLGKRPPRTQMKAPKMHDAMAAKVLKPIKKEIHE